MHGGFRTVAFAVFAVALGALIHVNRFGSRQSGLRGRQRILQLLGLLRNDPRLVSLECGINEGDSNENKERSKEKFARFQIALRVGGHGY